MSKIQAPDKNPDLGVWTPEYAKWALEELSDDDFTAQFKQSKDVVRGTLKIESIEKPQEPKPAVKKVAKKAAKKTTNKK